MCLPFVRALRLCVFAFQTPFGCGPAALGHGRFAKPRLSPCPSALSALRSRPTLSRCPHCTMDVSQSLGCHPVSLPFPVSALRSRPTLLRCPHCTMDVSQCLGCHPVPLPFPVSGLAPPCHVAPIAPWASRKASAVTLSPSSDPLNPNSA